MDGIKVYLDNCCYNRPYDDQSHIRITLETQAKLYIQDCIKNQKIILISSYILDYEISRNPHISTKSGISKFVNKFSTYYVCGDNRAEIEGIAKQIQIAGIKKMDALHLACAIYANSDYFLTTDDRILKYKNDKIKILNPVDFVSEIEEDR